jgi:mannose-6-phosphate isomerase-like protein (cupin superfamily)
MQTLIKDWPFIKNGKNSVVYEMTPSALANVPFHDDTKTITRFFAENFPVYLAVHEISPVMLPPKEYTLLHEHEDSDEVNIILSKQSLLYKIQVGEEEYIAGNNSCIWIPRGVMHSANVLQGAGYFITIRMN